MQRVTEDIEGIDDVFTYDTDLFAEAMKRSRPELYELAKITNRRGISTLRKYDLAVIVADAETYRRDCDRVDTGQPVPASGNPARDETLAFRAKDVAEAKQEMAAERVVDDLIAAMASLTAPMLEALIVARVTGHVAVEMPWEHGQGRVKSTTLCALINRSMIVLKLGSSWQFELTKHGYRALCAAGFITEEMYQQELADLAEEVEQAHAEALDIDARQQEENERVDTLIKQLDGRPAAPVNAPKISPEFLRQQAENEQAYAGIKAREEATLVSPTALYVTSTWSIDNGTQYRFLGTELVNGEQMVWLENPHGGQMRVTKTELVQRFTARFGVLLDTPRKLVGRWLQEGMILVSPDTSARYRFLRWDKCGAVVRNLNTGMEFSVPQPEIVENWRYLPQASADGVAQAVAARKLSIGDRVMHNRTGALGTVQLATDGVAHVTPDDPRDGVWRGLFSDFTRMSGPWHRTYLRHDLTGAVVEFIGYVAEPSMSRALWVRQADGELRRMKPWVLMSDYTACCEHGNGPRETCQGCGTEDEHGNQIEPERVPDTVEAWRVYARKLKASRLAAEEKVAELLAAAEQPQITISAKLIRDRVEAEGKLHALRCALAELVGRWQADGPLFERWSCGEVLNDLLTDNR